MKYQIPQCLGTSAVCDKIKIGLFDTKENKFISTWCMTWPKNETYIIREICEHFTDRLIERGFSDLQWGWGANPNVADSYISIGQIAFVTERVSLRKVKVTLDGKTYQLSGEKLDELLKSLE